VSGGRIVGLVRPGAAVSIVDSSARMGAGQKSRTPLYYSRHAAIAVTRETCSMLYAVMVTKSMCW